MLDQVLHNVQIDVGFKQGQPYLAQSFGDVLFRNCALAAKVLERTLQFFLKIFKHDLFGIPIWLSPLSLPVIACKPYFMENNHVHSATRTLATRNPYGDRPGPPRCSARTAPYTRGHPPLGWPSPG